MFEERILDRYGNIIDHYRDTVTSPGKYVVHYKEWLRYFPKEQILVLDGESFIKNPYKELKKVEKFIKLEPYFVENHFIYDQKKGFFCLNRDPSKKKVECMKSTKGRKHPEVFQKSIDKLKKFYKPYSQELFKLINEEPFWNI
jgi:hypothetical protein